MTFFRSRTLLPSALMLALTVASSRPGSGMPPLAFEHADKIAHAAAYALLALLWSRAWRDWKWGSAAAIGVAIVFGILDELHQSLVPGRFPDPFDLAADTVGAVLGVACYRLWRRRASGSAD